MAAWDQKGDAAFLLAVLSDGQWHTLDEIIDRSKAERGCGLTVHSRAATLRDRGHNVINDSTGRRNGRVVSKYRLASSLPEAPGTPCPPRSLRCSFRLGFPAGRCGRRGRRSGTRSAAVKRCTLRSLRKGHLHEVASEVRGKAASETHWPEHWRLRVSCLRSLACRNPTKGTRVKRQRFVVVSIDGWQIIGTGSRSGGSWRGGGRTSSVLDSLDAFREVARCRSEDHRGGPGSGRARLGVEGATRKAQRLAARLNAEEAA
jgi:hypothetical protein